LPGATRVSRVTLGGMTVRLILFVVLAMVSVAHADEPRDPVRLRVGTMAIDGSRYMKDILALGAEIEKRTRGMVVIDWVAGGQLGDESAMAALIGRGKLDGGGFSETGLVALVPEMAAWRAPGLFRDYAEVDRATAALDPSVRELFAKRDLTFAMWADLGFSHVFSTERVTSMRAVLDQAAPWLTMALDGTLTEQITSGQARAWTMPPLYMLAIGTNHARTMTTLRYRYVVGGLVFSKAAWAKLSAGERKAVLDVCREREPKIRASWRKETERGVAALAKAGVAIATQSEAELAAFAEAAAKRHAAATKEAGGELRAKIAAAAR